MLAAALAAGGSAAPVPAGEPTFAVPPGLRDGDLVFRAGRDMTSRIVLAQRDGSRWSHVGLVLLRDGAPWVVHAMPAEGGAPGGVRLEPLAGFAAPEHAAAIGFRRAGALDAAGRAALRSHALAQLGKPFDDAFRSSEKEHLFCTELVLDALTAAGQLPDIPRVQAPLHDEPIPTPEDLARWAGLQNLP